MASKQDDSKLKKPRKLPPIDPKSKMVTTAELMHREQKLIAELLIKFKGIVDLVPEKDGSENSPDARLSAAAQDLQIQVKTAELVKAAEDLLSLTRQLKEMWAFGKLREVGEGEEEGKLEEDAKQVGEMIEKLLEQQHRKPVETTDKAKES